MAKSMANKWYEYALARQSCRDVYRRFSRSSMMADCAIEGIYCPRASATSSNKRSPKSDDAWKSVAEMMAAMTAR